MEIEILHASTSKPLGKCSVNVDSTISDVKEQVHKLKKSLIPDRQSLRLECKGKTLKDSDTLQLLNIRDGGKLYVKDLGPQIGWKTVFLVEYAGPLLVYLWIYQRPWIFYDTKAPISLTTHIAAGCWTIHYAKRLLETLFVHRFSHATMPLRNLFKNCSYYWLFAGYVAYHVNHPKFTSPCMLQVYGSLAVFILCEIGNFAIHMNLRNLRPPGTKLRKIPKPDSNPFTILFNYVSCPNYTYEFSAWFAFSIMTQCIPSFMFAVAGMFQMTLWAIGKHKNYKKDFKDYPKNRKAVLPFIL